VFYRFIGISLWDIPLAFIDNFCPDEYSA